MTPNKRKFSNQRERVKPKPKSNLDVLIDYLILTNPKGLQKKIYETGGLAFSFQEPNEVYLKRNAFDISKNEGVEALFALHPDKSVILELFAPKEEQKETKVQDLKNYFVSNFTGVEPLTTEAAPKEGKKDNTVLIEQVKEEKESDRILKVVFFFLLIAALIYLLNSK